jgi:hypothetical protein
MVAKSWNAQYVYQRYLLRQNPCADMILCLLKAHHLLVQELYKPLQITASRRRADVQADPTRGPVVWSTDLSRELTQNALQGCKNVRPQMHLPYAYFCQPNALAY